jgi:hypothetical protein
MREGWRAALAHAGGVAGIAMSVEKILRTLAPATIRRNVPRRLCCDAARFRHFAMATKPILSRPDQDQA